MIKRQSRLKQIEASVNKANAEGRVIDREKLVATTCMQFGCSRRTALEYINTLVNAGRISLEVENVKGQMEDTSKTN